ncbi:hypothetical protein ElyMa_004918600 [Elysia marginata]|uniref:Uncharacterized protein n=1 Tax=Elysia marginata TaxID=1093978 RepID=A0AAV4J0A8_9GAST|nr:hypothetical protein ElyMa_004918600 [Elysia marginata]
MEDHKVPGGDQWKVKEWSQGRHGTSSIGSPGTGVNGGTLFLQQRFERHEVEAGAACSITSVFPRLMIIDIVQYLYYGWTAPAVTPAVTPLAIPTATHGGSSGDVPVTSGQQGQREKQGTGSCRSGPQGRPHRIQAVVGLDRGSTNRRSR